MMYTSDAAWPGLILVAEEIKKKVEACGGKIEAEATYPACCFAQDNQTRPDYAATNMADFQQKGITTILWTGGLEGNSGKAATALSYYPEWVIMGDSLIDGNNPVRLSQNTQAFDGRALIVTPVVFEPALE